MLFRHLSAVSHFSMPATCSACCSWPWKIFRPVSSRLFSSALLRRRDEHCLERAVDRLVIGDLVVDIGLVERGAVELAELGALRRRPLGQRLAGVVVLRRHVELLDQGERLLVHRLVVAHHVLGEGDARPCSSTSCSASLAASMSITPAV